MTLKINRKEDIINFVQELNDEIKEFIRNSLESSSRRKENLKSSSAMPKRWRP
jgi:hypothetical protein